MGGFVCLMKKSRIESGGDSGKIVMMNPPRDSRFKASRDSKGTDIVSTPRNGGRNSALLLFARRSSVVRFVHDAVTVRSGTYTSYTENYFR